MNAVFDRTIASSAREYPWREIEYSCFHYRIRNAVFECLMHRIFITVIVSILFVLEMDNESLIERI